MSDSDFAAAVFKDGENGLCGVPDVKKVVFYANSPGGWTVARELDFDFAGHTSRLCEMRARLVELILELNDPACKASALAAAAFPGISRDVLSRAGFTLYELESFDEGVLDGILENDGKGEDLSEEVAPSEPFERESGSGEYFLDMRLALNAHPELTSKKMLRPFLDTAKFVSLKVVCDHLPPWLPPELKLRKLSWDSEDLRDGVVVAIFPGEA
ncbi:MAG: hypothetical protein LBF41_00195 [Deltaproteobacteria bacterium]|jgi:hypothetical protein|nr:hypothetical protein [Deltaproteobacteria bacterium]